jgi:hypothetical protein
LPIRVSKLPNEPIIHALFTGKVRSDDVAEVFRFSSELAQDMPDPHIYRISEARDTDISFVDIMFILREMAQKQAGGSADPRFVPVLVGTSEDIQMIAQGSTQEQYGKLSLPLFPTYDEALTWVRQQITTRDV